MSEEFKDYKIVKLPLNGPKPGQSTEAWLYGKDKDTKRTRRILDARAFYGERRKP